MLGPQLVMIFFLEVLESLEGRTSLKNPLGVGPWWYAVPNFFLSGPLLSVHHEEKIPFIHTPTEVTFYPGAWGQVTVTQTL